MGKLLLMIFGIALMGAFPVIGIPLYLLLAAAGLVDIDF